MYHTITKYEAITRSQTSVGVSPFKLFIDETQKYGMPFVVCSNNTSYSVDTECLHLFNRYSPGNSY